MKASKLTGVMTLSDFKREVARLEPAMRADMRDGAKYVLVDGLQVKAAADQTALYPAQIHEACKRVLDGYVPDGWVAERVSLPKALAAQFARRIADERRALKESI